MASTHRSHSLAQTMARTLLLDVGVPSAAYFVAELAGASTYVSLLVGAAVAGARLVWVGLRQRRLDPFVGFLFVLFGVGLVLTFVTGDARFLLVKDMASSLVAGLVLLVSCLVGHPLAYYAAQRFAREGDTGQQDEFRAPAATTAMRRRWFTVSLVWGLGLLLDSGLRLAVIYLFPLATAANVSQILMLTAYGLLIGWTIYSVRTTHAVAASPA